MGSKDSHLLQTHHKDPEPGSGSRKPYIKPALIAFGRIEDVTLGPSPGVGESGDQETFKSEDPGFPG